MANENAIKTSMCITVDKDKLAQFRLQCRQNGMKMSTVINNMIADFLKKIPSR